VPPQGFFLGPTIFDQVHPDMTIARDGDLWARSQHREG